MSGIVWRIAAAAGSSSGSRGGSSSLVLLKTVPTSPISSGYGLAAVRYQVIYLTI